MNITETLDPRRAVTSVFRLLGRVRNDRVFHPDGLLLDGELITQGADPEPLPAGRHPVVARVSKAAGTPGGTPDVLGLAFRIGPSSTHPVDVTLASSGGSPLGRLLLVPRGGWRHTTFSSLMPYSPDDGSTPVTSWRWLIARSDGEQPSGTTALDAVAGQARRWPVRFILFRAGVADGQQPVGVLELREPRPDDDDPSFNPMRNPPPGWRLAPGWLSRLREFSYRGSTRGRKES